MSWKIRHEGSPQARATTLPHIVEGLRDGMWEPTDEVQGPGEKSWVGHRESSSASGGCRGVEPPPRVQEEETQSGHERVDRRVPRAA